MFDMDRPSQFEKIDAWLKEATYRFLDVAFIEFDIWWFNKSYGYPQSSSIFYWEKIPWKSTIQRAWGTPVTIETPMIYLVGGIPTPLKNMT